MFVVTHSVPPVVRLAETFAFVTDGLEAAVRQALGAAAGKEVVVMGGAETVRQAVNAGLVDELRIHLSPIILGAGTPLFESPGQRLELVQLASRATPTATHLTYEIKTS
jgi:dihydrofolate reductase